MPQTGPKNITDKALKAALRKSAGVYSIAARELGCDRSNITLRIQRSPKLQEFVASLEAEVDDLTDGIIVDTLGRRDAAGRPTKEAQTMARWRKDHQLRRRGVLMRLADPDGGPLAAAKMVIQIEYVDSGEPDEDPV